MLQELKKYICKIVCDENDKGTGFLVNRNTIITASHVIEADSKSIIAKFLELGDKAIECKCTKIQNQCDYDVEILVLDKEIDLTDFMPIDTNMVTVGAEWHSYGYPGETSPQIAPVGGILTNVHDAFNPCDFNIDLDVKTGKLTNYKGLSGAPLVIDEKVQGVLIHQNGPVLKAIEFSRVKIFFESEKIIPLSEIQEDNVSNVELISSEVMEEFYINNKLNEIVNNQNKATIILQGSVGIGKSTFVQYYKSTQYIKVIGKYFIKIPQDTMPISYRMSPDVFYEWLNEKISYHLSARIIDTQNLSYVKKIDHLGKLFSNLSIKLKENNEKALFFVDGIDELLNNSQEEIQRFLSFISMAKYEYIFFIVTSNNHSQLPINFLQTIDIKNNILEFKLYNVQQTKYYLAKVLNKELYGVQLENLSNKSMGHPLYLRYIINYINLGYEGDLNTFIDELPTYSGDIKEYYDYLWLKISHNSMQLHFAAFVSRIRVAIDKLIFRKVLPNEIKLNFETVFQQLRYLFLDENIITYFHNSFADFIKDKTDYMSNEIHHQIAKFCLENINEDFSVVNLLYHLSKGEPEDLEKSIVECNQSWIDKCTFLNVTPDLMIQDIKGILRLACKNGDYISVIRLLLLLERSSFRYNEMFINFAFEIAKAEISFNRPDKAMKYIIRKDTLVLSLEDTLYCLEKLIEKNYSEQAKEITIKLETIFMKSLEDDEGIPNILISSLLQAYQMCQKFDYKYFIYKSNLLIKMIHSSITEENKKDMNFIVGTSFSYNLWKKGEYVPLEYANENKLKVDEYTTELYVMLLSSALDMEYIYHKKNLNDYNSISKDIEKLVEIAPIEDNYSCIEVLIKKSRNYELVISLINNCKYYQMDCNLRHDNGIDISIDKFNSFFGYYRNQGYMLSLNEKSIDIYPEIFKSDWEKGINSLIKYVACIYGKGLYCKANNDYSSIENDYGQLLELLENKLFDFDQRIKFEYSYTIPEQVFPLLFKYITEYIIEFKDDEIDHYFEYIKRKAVNQLGIYSEGYFAVLFEIVYTLIRSNIDSIHVKKIVDLIFVEVKDKVMNRWERTPYLLDIVEMYNLIGCMEISKEAYYEMLKTSMGPTWYKEDQLSLLSESFEPMNSEDITKDLIKRNFILLDSAAGGMTFERYIRVEKESLIGQLWKKGFYNIAFNFLKVQMHPDMEALECNIKIENVDANKYGLKSYRIANSIFLDSSMLNILQEVKTTEKSLIWSLSEVFMFGDERYLNDYIVIQSNIINEMKRFDTNNLDTYFERIMTILVCDCDERKRYIFLKLYKKYLDNEVYDNILNKLCEIFDLTKKTIIDNSNKAILKYNSDIFEDASINKGSDEIEENLHDTKEEFYFEGTFGRVSVLNNCRKDITDADTELLKSNNESAINAYKNVLLDIRKGGWDIWKKNSGEEVSHCFENIIVTCKDPEIIVKKLETIITDDNYCRYWGIANILYNIIGNKCGEVEKQRIVSEIFTHLETIVIPNSEYNVKYNDIEKWDLVKDEKQVLLEILIWLAWFPDPFISQKIIDLLPWLIKTNKDYLNNILAFCLSEDINVSELCVTICLYLSDNQDEQLYSLICNYEFLGKIISSNNFIVKSTFLQIYKNYCNEFSNAKIYIETIESYFKSHNSSEEDIDCIDTRFLKKADEKFVIDKIIRHDKTLNNIEKELISNIIGEINPRNMEEFEKLNFALRKSFNRNTIHFGYLHTLLYKNLNKVLSKYVSPEKSKVIANDIRRINPYFPSPMFESFNCYMRANKLKELLYSEGNFNDLLINECICDGDYLVIYYSNYSYDERQGLKNINLESFIVPKNDKIDKYSANILNRSKHYSNQYIYEEAYDKEDIIYTVNLVEPTLVKGRSITQVLPNVKFKGIIRAAENDFKMDKWNSERVWSNFSGLAKNEGCQVIINSTPTNNLPKDKKLIVKISDEMKTIFLDMYDHSIIEMDLY
ncbi:S1 family peptidase [Clostridium algidicarnis]|uniref:S1 family peptidase n=1 Tax=Clostridium algidicarnis TaxID=37659 RepID=UPI001C0B214A|nr:serine protease [Clostridium algidicarnis]MBU3194932.1 serine protease [Clostridium algidicarnis]